MYDAADPAGAGGPVDVGVPVDGRRAGSRPWGHVAVAAGVAPWTWFLVRDLDARLDLLALGFPLVVVGGAGLLAVVAAAARWRAMALAAVSWLVVGLLAVVGPWVPRSGDRPVDGLRVVAANVVVDRSRGLAGADILAQDPDVVVVTELGQSVEDRLRAELRHAVRSPALPGQVEGDVGVYSRWPLRRTDLPDALSDQRGLRVVVEGPHGEFVVYALHLDKPSVRSVREFEVGFRTHRALVDAVLDAVRDEELPTMVVGDLNLVDRASGYRALVGELDDAMRSGWAGPTAQRSWLDLLLARVDHVLVPEAWCSTDAVRFHLRGSDHRGLAATVGPCPGERA